MKPLLPLVRKISAKTIGDDIVGVIPDEKMVDSMKRFLLEQRNKKIQQILKRKKGSD